MLLKVYQYPGQIFILDGIDFHHLPHHHLMWQMIYNKLHNHVHLRNIKQQMYFYETFYDRITVQSCITLTEFGQTLTFFIGIGLFRNITDFDQAY